MNVLALGTRDLKECMLRAAIICIICHIIVYVNV